MIGDLPHFETYSILVVNDDGPKSPLLVPFLDALAAEPWCRELRVVVPAQEQSWIAKAVSRFRALKATPTTLGNHSALLVEGTPADCASLGIHNLFSSPPDFVFSGVNMGVNAGQAFLLSSGTIGGVVEASLYRVPGIAFSAHMPHEVFNEWRVHNTAALAQHASDWVRLGKVAAAIGGRLAAGWDAKLHDLITVNLPWQATLDAEMVPTSLAVTHFNALFAEVAPGEYRHKFQGLKNIDPTDPSGHPYAKDLAVLEENKISVNPVKFSLDGLLSTEQLKRLKNKH